MALMRRRPLPPFTMRSPGTIGVIGQGEERDQTIVDPALHQDQDLNALICLRANAHRLSCLLHSPSHGHWRSYPNRYVIPCSRDPIRPAACRLDAIRFAASLRANGSHPSCPPPWLSPDHWRSYPKRRATRCPRVPTRRIAPHLHAIRFAASRHESGSRHFCQLHLPFRNRWQLCPIRPDGFPYACRLPYMPPYGLSSNIATRWSFPSQATNHIANQPPSRVGLGCRTPPASPAVIPVVIRALAGLRTRRLACFTWPRGANE